MITVLVTGATGFLGSAVAATLLARGIAVVAVSRNDPDRVRTESAVLDAARGFDLDIVQRVREGLTILDAGEGELTDALDPDSLRNVDAVWHCAAEMSYSGNKLQQAFRTNVCGTADLYKKVVAMAPGCRRFYYVSTAYTAGMSGGDTAETLHVGNPCVNTYQVTKWCAEQTLHVLHACSPVPVTIFRPTIVVGHQRTGWARRNGFGLYMFVDAIDAASRAGFKEVRININAEGRPDLIPIDRLVDNVASLTLRAEPGRDFEIFQCSGGCGMTTRQVVSTIGDVVGVNVNYGPPQTSLDQKIDRAIDLNRPFANTHWVFRRTRLDAAVSTADVRHVPVGEAQLRELVAWYCGDAAQGNAGVAARTATVAG